MMQTSMLSSSHKPCTTTSGQCRSGASLHSSCSTSYQQLPAFGQHRREQKLPRGARLVTRMGIKAVQNFDAAFDLKDDSKSALTELLSSETFCQQVAKDTQQEGKMMKFADVLFQPVPWSVQTKKGMPTEYEQYLEDPNYTIINIPPNFMFKAKIFKPSRLCAIYKAA